MSLWMVRVGKYGEHEQRVLDTNRIYATWEELVQDMSKLKSKEQLREVLHEIYPDDNRQRIINYSGQLWPFAHEMKAGDWVVVPSKLKPAIHFAEIVGPYEFDPNADESYRHSRRVKWIEQDVPRSNFEQDLLYSFGAFMTICRIERNNAESRIRKMAKSGWKPESTDQIAEVESPAGEIVDLEQLAQDQIAKLIIRRFKGHKLALLVEALLKVQGYETYRSPEGPDKGIDILAAPGPLGFGTPRICVQVKSGSDPVDRPTLDQLIGAMQNVQADQGLLVSWGGFKSTVNKEIPAQFFRVRLWSQSDLIKELLSAYDKLDDTLQAELPLKRIWTVAEQSEEAEG